MKVNSQNKSIAFNGFYNSKALKKTLEFAEHNGALFATATSLTLAAVVRPPAILAAPKTDKENKKVACAKSLVSTALDFLITLLISLPIVGAMGAITKNPQKYLKPDTIKKLTGNAESFDKSKAYTFINQMFKLGVGLIIAAPKAMLNVAGIPKMMEKVFPDKKETKSNNNVKFKGNGENKLAKFIGKIIDKKGVQEFAEKNKNSNYTMHIPALKDTLTTGVFAMGAYNSNKIKEERKGPLIYNSIISTGLGIGAAYAADSILKKPGEKFIEKLKSANPNDPKLKKYIDGFKIAKPVVIMGVIYYALIPLISTFFAERADKKLPIKNNK